MRPAVALALLLGFAGTAAAQSHYYVYCAGGRIEVDGREPEQMRIARGSSVCMLGQFGLRMDAESFARRNFGSVGASCSCR